MKKHSVLTVLLCLAAPACGDGLTEGTQVLPSALDVPDLAAFAQQMSRAGCTRIHACCAGKQTSAVDDLIGEDLEQCLELQLAADYMMLYPGHEIDESLAVYDAERAAECVAKLASLSCGPGLVADVLFFNHWSRCPGVLQGAIPLGQSCETALFCKGNAICHAPGDSNNTCESAGGEGSLCNYPDAPDKNTYCAPGLYCHLEAAGGDNRCHPKRQAGEDCYNGEQYPIGTNYTFVSEVYRSARVTVCGHMLTCNDGKCVRDHSFLVDRNIADDVCE